MSASSMIMAASDIVCAIGIGSILAARYVRNKKLVMRISWVFVVIEFLLMVSWFIFR